MHRYKVILLLSGLGLILWVFWIEPASLKVRSHEVQISHLPKSLAGLRIAVIGDLHIGAPQIDLKKLREIVTTTNAQSPDIILLAGDFLISEVVGGTYHPPKTFASIVGEFSAPLGVWAVLGNHDLWEDPAGVVAHLERQGIRVLRNGMHKIEGPRGQFLLAGAEDFGERGLDSTFLRKVADYDGASILFTHNPDIFPELPDGITLAIAAHTHGGQVSLPGFGAPIVPSRYGQRYVAGHIVEQGQHYFVTTGIGTSIIPVRFRVPPEISLLHLNSD